MTNRKNLHDYGLALISLAVLHLFIFITSVVSGFIDGTISEALATVDPEILVAVKVMLCIFGVIIAIIVCADAFIGIQALKVSANPTADKWHINLAKVFFVLSAIAVVFAILSFFDSGVSSFNAILNLVNAILSVGVYFLFIKAASAVRNDALNATK